MFSDVGDDIAELQLTGAGVALASWNCA